MRLNTNEHPHRRLNILTGEWVLVSPHRTNRPWQGKQENIPTPEKIEYDPTCYLCPGNKRADGDFNPDYTSTFSFENDFAAILEDTPKEKITNGLLEAVGETGICKVICFSPNHSLTLPLLNTLEISDVIRTWQKEYRALGSLEYINHVQIFENKGSIMGCSNPHPHGQIWAQHTIPDEVVKKTKSQLDFWKKNKESLLLTYLKQELENKERIVFENTHFVALVPFWAVWPYEIMVLPKRHLSQIALLSEPEITSFAETIKVVCTKYDNLFQTSFPYSMGIHQAPTDGLEHKEWHFHMSFYPPLLRSATIKKFMVGYEMFAYPQRDISAEIAAKTLKELPDLHYSMV